MYYVSLDDKHTAEERQLGKKACSLMKLKAQGRNVPGGIVLPAAAFNTYVQDLKCYEEIRSKLEEIHTNPIYARKNLSGIRERIMEECLSREVVDAMVQALEGEGIRLCEGVCVRSSSINEDAFDKAYAGVYTSYIDIRDREGLEKAVRSVWASAFSETAFLYGARKYEMAVIIQKMVYADTYGVVFTKAPNMGEQMYIELSGEVTGIVDGGTPRSTLYADRITRTYENTGVPVDPRLAGTIITEALELEGQMGMYCDIEFAVKDGSLHILQCRPLSETSGEAFDYRIFSQDDEAMCGRYYLGSCMNMYIRYLGKQSILRRAVTEAGFSVYKQYFAIIKKGCIHAEFQTEIEDIFSDSDFVILEFGEKKDTVLCRREQMCSALQAYEAKNPRAYTYVRIGEVIQADISGYATVNAENDVFVEYVPARMQGMQKGICPATSVLLHGEEHCYISKPLVPVIEKLDEATGKRVKTAYGRQAPELTREEGELLGRFARKLNEVFPNARLEWYIYRGKLYGKDISMEKDDLDISYGGRNILSKGTASGPVYVLEELEFLDEVAERYNISLFAHSVKEDAVKEDEQLNVLLQKMCRNGKPVILARRPSVGIMAVLDSISGVVFMQGAVLSHVGICLREKKIPAVFRPELFEGELNGLSGRYVQIWENGSVEII